MFLRYIIILQLQKQHVQANKKYLYFVNATPKYILHILKAPDNHSNKTHLKSTVISNDCNGRGYSDSSIRIVKQTQYIL